ncbi:hypothetical protein PRBRB14_15580 [Hallella multisaccharivorax DSM 17128]|uniref:Substrate import-associated zinc metallohydrolase lipoprotein n=1 Tax=Hallella multisaccharivorax DSM 17128 TaxID=688246 RepID=F8NC73_9BACT|nr:putative zinc-binding metallopeptidase [Hallella multisaccharivorax]EGN58044.1 hypothetical protein Premu_2691 [Hallella multisaccharivorax DSM 17128]GJG30679.1 hypothetical protein PRBRB14_15580 [Hallella multisaccharivorax DSM 17128]
MKYSKIIIIGLTTMLTVACSEDDLSSQSIFTDTKEANDSTELDRWTKANFTDPYNIRFYYRYNDKETSSWYNVVPADYNKSVALAMMVKHVWMDAYTELMGKDFLKIYSPRVYQLIGSPQYSEDGSIVLGVAEGGVKVTLFRVNNIDIDHPVIDVDSPQPDTGAVPIDLNYWFFHTMHHEFCHILTQKKNYSTEFQTISTADYQASNWINVEDVNAPAKGFVSGYASKEYNEDFAEIYSTYVTHTKEAWDKLVSRTIAVKFDENGDTVFTIDKKTKEKLPTYDYSGYNALMAKLGIVKDYFKNQWDIDMDKLRAIVLRRSQEVSTLDLRHLK